MNYNFLTAIVENSSKNIQTTGWSATINMLGQFFFLSLTFAIVIAIAMYSLKIIGKLNGLNDANSNIKLIETKTLGRNNYVHLIKVGDKMFFVSSSKDRVCLISEVNDESIEYSDSDSSPIFPENNLIKSWLVKIREYLMDAKRKNND